MRKPFQVVLAPHFAVNRGTLLSVFGESNRDKNTQLMRWLKSKIPKILRRKRGSLAWYIDFRANLQRRQTGVAQNTVDPSLSSAEPSTNIDPTLCSTTLPPQPDHPTSVSHQETPTPAIEVDLDASPVNPPPVTHFNINTHIRILERDIEEIESFESHVKDILGRTTQRVKERLGRRVWQGKDIYLLTDGDARRKVSRSAWRTTVQFKPRLALLSTVVAFGNFRRDKTRSLHLRSGWIAGLRGPTDKTRIC